MNDVYFSDNKAVIKNTQNFDLKQTLDCGQAFRFKEKDGKFCGIVKDKYIEIHKKENEIIIENTNKEDFDNLWYDYFDLGRDYSKIIESFKGNETLYRAAKFSSGIRILKQEPFEALCSFIISQNNNIPRIKGIIDRLCTNFGDKIKGGYTFPTAEVLSRLTEEDLSVIRSGFRAKYIVDAARRVASGETDLKEIKNLSYTQAAAELMKIKGVGPKVADCALLYGFSFTEAFPKDVWIKRALAEYFGGEIPECAKQNAGIAQQYIFYYIRETTS